MKQPETTLPLAYRLGIDTGHEPVIFLRSESPVARSEGFESMSRITVEVNDRKLLATLMIVYSELLEPGHAGLSEKAWRELKVKPGERLKLSHAPQIESLAFIRAKAFGHKLNRKQYNCVIRDIVDGLYMNVHLASFITACANGGLEPDEIVYLTEAMVNTGQRLEWDADIVVDKHCIGGLPGNRTSPIVVSILAANGLTIPKTSSRAITSPAGTADVMETMTNVDFTFEDLKSIVKETGGCLAWGGSVSLSPSDDILITVEKALDIDFEGQLIASILSKKIAAGSDRVLIDIPVGKTAKMRSKAAAEALSEQLVNTGKKLGIIVKVVLTDGSQPIGNGVGPALEAQDVLSVLRNEPHAPQDLKERALSLAGNLLELAEHVPVGRGYKLALDTLKSGQACKKFMQICMSQGGFCEPRTSSCTYAINTKTKAVISEIDNRQLARLAKLAGAPADKTAGIYLHAKVGDTVDVDQPLLTIHADSPGELEYALNYYLEHSDMILLKDVQ
ncbi:thymidine phosphorylase family protein [Kangiella sediminilitoris]|uniref:Putative thymidine phosphorylase n=1 Tax=Kangiella sediminilitoris TaxID=1144748 RepID=A0A1B3BAP8_9GAMM|nr:thymidine phosphorylase family protein [Kangiella sediminilitoris]AOE49860.1 Putative thymidine phosphorylase [Kangiella sediminilitoris]